MKKITQLRPTHRLLAVICLLLPACQQTGTPAPVELPKQAPTLAIAPRPAPSTPDSSRELIEFLIEQRKSSPIRLAAEAAQLRSKVQQAPTTENRLRLAFNLAFTPGEEQEALALLEAAADHPKSPETALIIDLIASNLRERRRYRDNVSSLQSRNREAGRQQEDLKARQEGLKRQIEELEGKLAALKNIEKSLLQRP